MGSSKPANNVKISTGNNLPTFSKYCTILYLCEYCVVENVENNIRIKITCQFSVESWLLIWMSFEAYTTDFLNRTESPNIYHSAHARLYTHCHKLGGILFLGELRTLLKVKHPS